MPSTCSSFNQTFKSHLPHLGCLFSATLSQYYPSFSLSLCLRADRLSVSVKRESVLRKYKPGLLILSNHFIISIGIQNMDHIRTRGFLLLLWTTLFALQFSEARVLEQHFLQHHSAVTLDSDLHAVAVASSTAAGGHALNYPESNRGSNYGNSTHAANNTIITVELLQKEATPGDGSRSKAPVDSEEVAPIEGNVQTQIEIEIQIVKSHSSPSSVNDGIQGNILSSSGRSPGVGHWEKSKSKSKYSTSPVSNVLPSGPSPGVGNAHTSAVGVTQSQSDTFNKLPSGPSPGGGHKVTNGYTEMTQESESKKSAIMNILPSGPSPEGGNSATNGRNTMEEIITEKDEEGSGIQTFNRLPSGPSPGVGHSYTNTHVPENIKIASAGEDRKGGDHIPIFHKLPGGPSPGGGHSSTDRTQLSSKGGDHIPIFHKLPGGPSPGNIKIASAGEDRKGGDHIPIFHKLPGGPSPGGGHSSTDRTQLSSLAPVKTSSSPRPGDGNSSMNKLKAARRSEKKKMEQTAGALDRKIGCDGGGLDFYGTPTPPMFRIATAGS